MESDLDQRLRFYEITAETQKALQVAWKAVDPVLSSILDVFYRHLATEPETARILGNHTERLKGLQRTHWERLFSGRFDDDYVKGVYSVGMVHKRIGLQPRWFLAGYRYIQHRLTEVLLKKTHGGPRAVSAVIGAVQAAILLDIDLAISAYQDAIEAEKQKAIASVLATFGTALEKLQQGDLSSSVQTEINGDFRKMRDDLDAVTRRFRETIASVLVGAREVQASANEIAHTATELSTRTIEEAASLQESAAQASEVSKLVKRSAESALELSRSVSDVKSAATAGEGVLREASEVMLQIDGAATEIAEIVTVIDEISDQTNLLSLNAAIEAAHAGQAGKGFEVVAGEVRKLANQAQESAKNIKKIVATSKEVAVRGVELVRKSGENFQEVTRQVAFIETLVAGISQAAQEQAFGVEKISQAVRELSTVTHENATIVQQATNAAQALESLSQRQTEALGFFRTE